MVNIADVAKAVGVSRSTVSYALSGNRPISRETRERIDAAIADLGFTVNAGARALATSQTMVLGLLLQFHDDEFPPAMLQYILAITTAARELGYDILMITDDHGAEAIQRITSSNMVDGVVLLDVTHEDPRLPALMKARQPAALVGLPRDTDELDVFDLDFEGAARLLVDHLHDLGHREIVLVSPPRHVFDRGGAYAWRFRDAALERAAQHGLTVHAHYGESQQPAVERSLNAILDAHAQATGVIVHNDASIAALPAVLRERGTVVPRDLSVVSLYPRNFGRTFLLPYTAVETSPDGLGREAVQQLVRRIVAPQGGPSVVRFIEPELTDRGSTA
ncbi:LacI family DNA-binding transcriptional regulator [Microbacterium enclense]|uniref:Transcriptional regulator, LacI family n=1 Tax=Microbacterium enclense TaxID=993073 RepID=A0A1G6IUT4_9MICO|nr:LacI family DNA-binding transcriptional regulator [Microbacterium enclense]KSU54669.1 transcriptional regulator [Microbacterium enclense]SDC10183.1 transcriptional regulator, LacI family [Microbacterium enclense]